ncbi:MAG: CPBP family intramembrane glutamic endopeptidase [Chloroflexota bacterium]|nr:CPBP family intramembrane glutamic endopeptidase [Chloroflexota bacterium]
MNNEIPQEEITPKEELAQAEELIEEEPFQSKRPLFENIFISSQEPRLRAGWRLVMQALFLGTLMLGLEYIVSYYLFRNNPSLEAYNFFTSQGIMFLSTIVSVYAARILLDQRSIISLGLKMNTRTWIDLAAGIGISALMMGIIFLVEWVFGWLKFEGFAWNLETTQSLLPSILITLGIFIIVGWQEELLSRGYWLQNLENGLNIYWAVGISSFIFAASHIWNPSFSIISLIGLIISAIFLAYGYTSSRRLWLPIGLHIGWNFFEGSVFGFPVSGLRTPSLILHTVNGPILWTGGDFGPEAGLILLLALTVGIFFIWAYTQSTAPELEEVEETEEVNS